MYAPAKSGYYAKTIYHGYLAATEPARRSAKYFALSLNINGFIFKHACPGCYVVNLRCSKPNRFLNFLINN